MNILAISQYRPSNVISLDALCTLNGTNISLDCDPLSGQEVAKGKRYSCLPWSYIEQTLNAFPKDSVRVVEEDEVYLGAQAMHNALATADIRPSQIGLLVGETSAQMQTIPGLAQRVAEKMALRVRSFDFSHSACSFVNYLKTIMAWKDDRTPDYIGCVAVHLPLRFVDFRSDEPYAQYERTLLGDGAYAMILSPRKEGIAKVLDTWWQSRTEHADVISLSLYGHIHIDYDLLWQVFECEFLNRLRLVPIGENDLIIVPGILYQKVRNMTKLPFDPKRLIDYCYQDGYALGADSGIALAQVLPRVAVGTRIRLFAVDGGGTFGETLIVKSSDSQ
jgi:3-oxoacyl-[acyl-carrier-protein] synthase III